MDINRSYGKSTTDVNSILIANPIANAWNKVKTAFAAPQLAPALV